MRHIVVSYYIRDTVCRSLMHHMVVSYYNRKTVCRTFMHHIVVSYYISDNVCCVLKKNQNPKKRFYSICFYYSVC